MLLLSHSLRDAKEHRLVLPEGTNVNNGVPLTVPRHNEMLTHSLYDPKAGLISRHSECCFMDTDIMWP